MHNDIEAELDAHYAMHHDTDAHFNSYRGTMEDVEAAIREAEEEAPEG